MANKRPTAEDFVIRRAPTCPFCNNALMLELDLTRPEFEPQVMRAAARFQALRRKTRGGGRPRKDEENK
jgi:hypothetical protein